MWDDTKNVVFMTGNISDKCYVYFDAVQKAIINEIITSDITLSSMTITINATKGTFDISKYYYSIDNGTTWNESTSNIISISGLTKGTTYAIKAYVQDVKNINSDYKNVDVSTLNITLISFTFSDIIYNAEEGMTWEEFINSSYNTTSNSCFEYASTGSVSCFVSQGMYCSVKGVRLSDTIISGRIYEKNGCEKSL